MDKKENVQKRLRELENMQKAVKVMEVAMQSLTPEERLVTQMLLIDPQKGNVQRLCQLLCLEESSIYRRRKRALEKLEVALFGDGQCV